MAVWKNENRGARLSPRSEQRWPGIKEVWRQLPYPPFVTPSPSSERLQRDVEVARRRQRGMEADTMMVAAVEEATVVVAEAEAARRWLLSK
uniref:Uncharacterized protein n=1 Tax=Oryza rufipogon TaxID=4529 RepID=A0A0E0P7D1_ORYRU